MGRRGPPPTPSALLRLRGSWRGEYVNRNEPEPEMGIPEAPEWLDDYAKEIWAELVPQLDAMGVLATIDRYALTLLCDNWSQWRIAREFVRKHGETYPVKDESGRLKYLKKFPQVSIADTCAKTLKGLMQEFGLTPSARTRIEVKGREEDSGGKERFLNLA